MNTNLCQIALSVFSESMTPVPQTKPKQVKPKRDLRKVFASMRQVIRVHHVAEGEAIWRWGKALKASLPSELTLCVWNVWKQSGGKSFEFEFKHLTAEADLFLGQEALITREALSLFARPPFEVIHAATYRRMDGCRDGVITLSTSPTVVPPKRIISATAEPLLRTTKAALLTYYYMGDVSKSLLAVVNFHSTLLRRPKTAHQEILRIIEHLESHEGPVIFAGDFNTFSKAHFREMEKALKLLGIIHILPKEEPRKRLARLDQLFVRGLEVTSLHVDTSFKHSDHFPLICKLSLAT